MSCRLVTWWVLAHRLLSRSNVPNKLGTAVECIFYFIPFLTSLPIFNSFCLCCFILQVESVITRQTRKRTFTEAPVYCPRPQRTLPVVRRRLLVGNVVVMWFVVKDTFKLWAWVPWCLDGGWWHWRKKLQTGQMWTDTKLCRREGKTWRECRWVATCAVTEPESKKYRKQKNSTSVEASYSSFSFFFRE